MILSYYYRGATEDTWVFEETPLDRVNLLVGASGSGKTRFLNTLFNFGLSVVKGARFAKGTWKLTVSTDNYEYKWDYEGVGDLASGDRDTTDITNDRIEISREVVTRKQIHPATFPEEIVNRHHGEFYFCGKKLPKLEKDKMSVTLLKEEETIQPLYDLFAKIQRRKFHTDALDSATAISPISPELIQTVRGEGIDGLWRHEFPLSVKLFFLKEIVPSTFEVVMEIFRGIFPTITECEIRQIESPRIRIDYRGILPALLIREKGIRKWIPLHELSSGMQKVLLIVTDVLTLPKGSTYIIDEYENSLGVNAIDFLPQFLVNHGEDIQFFITTHHPYLINSMPMNSWKVFHRSGCNVSIRAGTEFEKKYGKSKQKAFIQLINDPFYLGTGE